MNEGSKDRGCCIYTQTDMTQEITVHVFWTIQPYQKIYSLSLDNLLMVQPYYQDYPR